MGRVEQRGRRQQVLYESRGIRLQPPGGGAESRPARFDVGVGRRYGVLRQMSAKEQLRERVEAFSEGQAERTLRLLDLEEDPVSVALTR